jgi:drug/metabolite transporter (DMT)-like permease
MNAVLLGVVAALAWGLTDFLIRFVSRSVGSLQSILIVFVSATVALLAAMFLRGETLHVVPEGMWILALAGIAWALSYFWLFQAFAIGPISLVAPIVGAYPVLTMGWAVAMGAKPGALEWFAVAVILMGVALVARFAAEARPDVGYTSAGKRSQAIMYALLTCLASAVSLTAGQAAAHDGGDLNAIVISRLWSLAVIAPLCVRDRGSFSGATRWLPVLILMGVLDALALSAVVLAGKLEGAHYATVVGSCFGVVTVVLAMIFLRERLTKLQFLGMLMILGGVVVLSGRY